MLADRLGDGQEDDPGAFSSSRKVVATDAVEHRVDRDLARALDPGEHLLLLDRDAELLVDPQDFGIDLVEAAELGPRLGRGVIISVLVIDLGCRAWPS